MQIRRAWQCLKGMSRWSTAGGDVGGFSHESSFGGPFSLTAVTCCKNQWDRSSAGKNRPPSTDQIAWTYFVQDRAVRIPASLMILHMWMLNFILPLSCIFSAVASSSTGVSSRRNHHVFVLKHSGVGKKETSEGSKHILAGGRVALWKRTALLSYMMMSFIQNTESTGCKVRQGNGGLGGGDVHIYI